MTEITGQEDGWKLDLPTFDGLLEISVILRPFSRLGIPFFRSAPSTTDVGQLGDLRDLTADAAELEGLDTSRVKKALVDLQSLAKQVKTSQDASGGGEKLERLCDGYLRGFYLTSHVEGDGMAQVARQCLLGLQVLSSRLADASELHDALVGSVFPDTHSGQERFLTSVFSRPKATTDRMQRHHLPRTDIKTGISTLGSEPVRDIEADAIHQLDQLDLFVQLVQRFERLPSSADRQYKSTKAGIKAKEQAERCRPLRLTLEAHLAKCELATALASADNAAIKRRAIASHDTGEAVSVASTRSDDGDEGASHDSANEEEEKAKPVIAAVESASTGRPDPAANAQDDERWDERAEDALLACLETTCTLLRGRHLDVLADIVHRSDWVGDESSKGKVQVTSKVEENNRGTESDDFSESDSDSDDGRTVSGPHCPAPLRAIFRLQDRYEELRLAVWLVLPVHSRGKMAGFMRGVPTEIEVAAWRDGGMVESEVLARSRGRVAEAWDHLGLLLLKHFDSADLLEFGLDIEKLDKWQDYASSKEGSRAKRGRKTV